ncbi:hypothetical protein J4558_16600 [Leptolyngbya sp. 15MV]|nr:hypothetical protein J4558_16600 [Leptolyngbya sp. 15MV]
MSEKDPTPMVAKRQSLPITRESVTHKFMVDRHEGYLTIGLYPDGRPGEIFIKMAKEGSFISGMCQAFCRAFSIALQYGLTVEEAVLRAEIDRRFGPARARVQILDRIAARFDMRGLARMIVHPARDRGAQAHDAREKDPAGGSVETIVHR